MRTTSVRAVIGLVVAVAFAIAAMFGATARLPQHRQMAIVSGTATHTIAALTTAPVLRTAKAKAPKIEPLSPNLGPALPAQTARYWVPVVELIGVIDVRAAVSTPPRLDTGDRHRSRAPPSSV